MKSIIPNITRYVGETTYLIVSNPVDVMTYVFCKPYVEITHADPFLPSMSASAIKKVALSTT